MSPFFVPGVLKLCDSAEVSTKNSSSSYGLPILRNQPNWCSNGGERIPMGSLFEITPCTYCVCKPGGYWDECRRQTCPNYYCDFFEFPSSDPCCPVCRAAYNCTAPDGEIVVYKEPYFMNENEVCHCLGREPNDTTVCVPVYHTTNVAPVVG
uniref:Uncharacterized protein n=1 Tax=Magallana gigas TaxID=29159 RepID=K1PJN6_MAGGI